MTFSRSAPWDMLGPAVAVDKKCKFLNKYYDTRRHNTLIKVVAGHTVSWSLSCLDCRISTAVKCAL